MQHQTRILLNRNDTMVPCSFGEDDCFMHQIVVIFSLSAKMLFSVVCLCILFCIIVAMVAMRKTKRTYFVIKTLSSMLLGMDCVTVILCLAIVNFPASTSYLVLPFWILSVELSYAVIVIMSVERTVALYYPLRYLRWTAKESRVSLLVGCVWFILSVIFTCIKIGVCYVKHGRILFEVCTPVIYSFFKVCIPLFAGVLLVCQALIYRIIRLKRMTMTRRVTETSPQTMFKSISRRKYDSTILSFLLMLCLVLLLAVTAILHALEVYDTVVLTLFVCFTLLNSLLNSVCYVWWFKECRMNVLAMISSLSRRLRTKVMAMRIDVFDIVTTSSNFNDATSV